MKIRGIEVYKNVQKKLSVHVPDDFNFHFSFDYTPKVDMFGNNPNIYRTIRFKDPSRSDSLVHESRISKGTFTTAYRRWFTNWKIEAYDGEENLIWDLNFEDHIRGQKLMVCLDSSSLGDTLAWLPVVDLFRKKFSAEVYVTTFWNELSKDFFPDLKFHPPGFRHPDARAIFGIGWYEEEDRNIHKRDPREISLQQVAGDILGITLSGDALPPEIPYWLKDSQRSISQKYVCLATESTANAKHWHYPEGWQKTVDHLKSLGYEVVVIHSQDNTLEGVIDKTGNRDILTRLVDLYHADFFIGIGSGLSWLAWALRKPVVMISGFSLPLCEFKNLNYRIINSSVCHGCFNDVKHKFDRGDWNWCPRLKNTERIFECSTKITADQVISKIDLLILEQEL